jgi:hypothetical protein
VKCETIFFKSFKKCGISNSLDGAVDDELFLRKTLTSVIVRRIVATRILGDSVTSRNFILSCHFVE